MHSLRKTLLPQPKAGLLMVTLLLAWLPHGALGQVNDAAQEQDAGAASTRLEELIETLESDTARSEFINELKTLAEATQAPEEEPTEELADAVKIDERARAWKRQYVAFLERYGLNASLVGYISASVGILLVTVVALLLVRKVIGVVYRRFGPLIAHYNLSRKRIGFYVATLRLCAYAVVLLVAVGALAALWNVEVDSWIPQEVQLLVLQAIVSVVTVVALGAFVTEAATVTIEHFFRSRFSANSARMNTLLPIARTVLLLTLFTLFGLTLLSELGLNVMPLLAGAGVVGFAVGFGAQALIKDVLNGFIIIVEDLIQVGDVATLGGKSGLIEKITIRKVQLRDLAGTVYTVPFSEVAIVSNLTKDFSYYLMDVGVAYREDTDQVVALLRQIDEQMRAEDEYKDLMLEPIEILGVDRFADSAVIIKARVKTPPLQQWSIGREFNRRMKQLFDRKGIEIPFPHQTIYFGQDKDGTAPPMQVHMQNQPSANDAASPGGSSPS
jgi:small-conductance mechanosensitive channel